jgi:hypothetical protein
MAGSPKAQLSCIGKMQTLNKCEAAWAELSWHDCVRFRGFEKSGFRLLVGAEAGEHYFLVCVLGDRGALCNVIPHRYVMSASGRLVHGFDGLGVAEREESCRIEELPLPSIEDMERYKELGSRGFSVNLPPQYTVQSLLNWSCSCARGWGGLPTV